MLFFAATTLTGLHFVMTTLMTVGLRFMGYIQPSHLPFLDLAKFALCANFSIVGMNVSLMWNSVGFYQVKYCNLPAAVLGNAFLPQSKMNFHGLKSPVHFASKRKE